MKKKKTQRQLPKEHGEISHSQKSNEETRCITKRKDFIF